MPAPLAQSIQKLMGSVNLSELRAKVVEDVVAKVVKGVCTNQIDLCWTDRPSTSSVLTRVPRVPFLKDLPPHPKDLQNESKARGLEIWRQRCFFFFFAFLFLTVPLWKPKS